MDPNKVLIIDQNILVRRAISNILQQEEEFEVCWIAEESPNIKAVVREHDPDVVLLSLEDMQSEGFTILSMLRIKFPKLPVLIISPRTTEGAEAAINALRVGAIDFITKPEHKNLILFAERHLEKRLTPLIKAAKKIHDFHSLDSEILESLIHPQRTFEQIKESEEASTTEIVVIGGCTGGVQALFKLVSALPADLQVPVVIVQHLPRTYTKYLASKLDSVSDITVREVQGDEKLESGDVWIARGGYQCEISQSGYRYVLNTHRGLRENNMRPSIDVLFRSAAHTFGNRTLGILLSGCGYDGVAGAEEIRNHEGQILVQDPRSAIAPELPLSAIKKGLTREYYSPVELAEEIVRRIRKSSGSKVVEDQSGNTTIGNTLIF